MSPESEGLLAPSAAGAPGKFPTWRADAALVGNTVIWGTTFVLVQAALHVGPLSVSQPLLVIVDPCVSVILSIWLLVDIASSAA